MTPNETIVDVFYSDNAYYQLCSQDRVILKISEKGFEYKGQLIDDAGACYAALMEFLINANHPCEAMDKKIALENQVKKLRKDRNFWRAGYFIICTIVVVATF